MKRMGKFLPKSQEFGMVHLQQVLGLAWTLSPLSFLRTSTDCSVTYKQFTAMFSNNLFVYSLRLRLSQNILLMQVDSPREICRKCLSLKIGSL